MSATLEQAITIALELSPQEQAQLLEQLASHLANVVLQKIDTSHEEAHWGKKTWAILEQLDTSDWDTIEDPVAWVKAQRQQSQKQLDLDDD